MLETALSTLLRSPIAIVGAGRTDAGVHAKEMYAHFDFEDNLETDELVLRLNAFLPNDIAIIGIFAVPDDAHARFDASARTYQYWVVQKKDPFNYDWAHLVRQPLNIEAMNKAAGHLMKYDDFACFSKSNTDVKTFICDIRAAFWQMEGDVLVFTITADRFLRNMVRAIVGTLLDVGLDKMPAEGIKMIIESRDRSMAGASVPAKGLYLTKVNYPENILS